MRKKDKGDTLMAGVFISPPFLLSFTDLSKQECGLVNHTTTRPNNTNMMVKTLRLTVKTTAALC